MRTLTNTSGVVAGGSIYWLIVIYPNTTDTWTKVAIGNIRAYSLAGYTVWQDRLLEISDIDQSVDIFGDLAAKIAEASFTLQNMDDSINPAAYFGRKVEIRLGAGATMTEATTDVIFTGKIMIGTAPYGKRMTFKCSGLSRLWNKEVGKKVPETVMEKYRGGIYPIQYGDNTDDDAYCPIVFDRPQTQHPDCIVDLNPIYLLNDLVVFDSKSKRAYPVLRWDYASENSLWTVSPDKNKITFGVEVGNIPASVSIGPNDTFIAIDSTIDYSENRRFGAGAPPSPLYLKTAPESELLSATGKPELIKALLFDNIGSTIFLSSFVSRGRGGTEKKTHNSGDPVLKMNDTHSSFKLPCLVSIDVKERSDYRSYNNNGTIPSSGYITPRGSQHFYETPDETTIQWKHNNNNAGDWYTYNGFTLVFEPLEITGEVIEQRLTADITLTLDLNASGVIAYPLVAARVVLDDAWGGSIVTIASRDSVGTTVFNSYLGDGSIDMASLKLANIEDINSRKYSILLYSMSKNYPLWQASHDSTLKVRKLGLIFFVNIDPAKFEFYARLKGRKNPGGYFNGSSGDLIENPSSVIEDICRTSVDGMSATDLDETSFDALYTARANWKLAFPIYTEAGT